MYYILIVGNLLAVTVSVSDQVFTVLAGGLLDAVGGTDLDDFEDMPPTYGAVLAGKLSHNK